MTYTPRTQSSNSEDLHRLVGQIIDHRLRVMSLHYASPRQWLYQVEPPSVGKTRRALKVLGDPLAREPGAFYRLKTSYERLKRIESPYIEKVYECGLLHDLTPYVLVSWEPHISLYEHLRRQKKPMAWREAQGLLSDLGMGLEALHNSGVAHGDIRAQHVLLRQQAKAPILIDACVNSAFGSPPVPGLDKSSAYWAPERNTLSTASTSSDMYSFGVLMYLCLHNQLPFSPLHDPTYNQQLNRHDMTSPMRWLEEAHVGHKPRPCAPKIPLEIRDLITRLLSKSPRERPTASEVSEVLRGERKSLVEPHQEAVLMSSTANTSTDSDGYLYQETSADELIQVINPQDQHSKTINEDQELAGHIRAEYHGTRVTGHQGVTLSTTRVILMVALSSISVIVGLLLARL